MACSASAMRRSATHSPDDRVVAATVRWFSFHISHMTSSERCMGRRGRCTRPLTTLASLPVAQVQSIPTTALHPTSLRFFSPLHAARLPSPLPLYPLPSPARPPLRPPPSHSAVVFAIPTLEKLTRAAVLSRRRRLAHRHPSLSSLSLSCSSLPASISNLAPALPPPSTSARYRWPNPTIRRSIDRREQGRPGTHHWQWLTPHLLDPSIRRTAWESMHRPERWEKKVEAARAEKNRRVREVAALVGEDSALEPQVTAEQRARLADAVHLIRRLHSPLLDVSDYSVLMTAAVRGASWPLVLELWDEVGIRSPASLLTPHLFNCTLFALLHTDSLIDQLPSAVFTAVLQACAAPSLRRLVTLDSLYLAVRSASDHFVSASTRVRLTQHRSIEGPIDGGHSSSAYAEPDSASSFPLHLYYQQLSSLITACASIHVYSKAAVYGVVVDALADTGHLRDAVCWYLHAHRDTGTPVDTHQLVRLHRIWRCAERALQPLPVTPQLDPTLVDLRIGEERPLTPLSTTEPNRPTCAAAASLGEEQLRMFLAWELRRAEAGGLLPVSWSSLTSPPYHLTIDLTSIPTSPPTLSAVSSTYLPPLLSSSPTYLAALQDLLTRLLPSRISGRHTDGIGLHLARSSPIWSDLSLTINTHPGTRQAVESHFGLWLERITEAGR